MSNKAKYICSYESYNARRAFSAALFKTDLLLLTTSANCCRTSGGAPGPSCCITLISSLVKWVLCAKSVAEVANRWTSCCLAVSPQVKDNSSCSRGICQSCSLSGSCCRKLLQHYVPSIKMSTLSAALPLGKKPLVPIGLLIRVQWHLCRRHCCMISGLHRDVDEIYALLG